MFSERFPVFKDKKWLFIIDQELVFDKYDKEFLPQISKAYHKLGFPETFSVRALVDAQASQDKVNEFKLKKEENDQLMAQEYTKMIETAEKKKEQSREDSHSGPIKLGRAIPANEEVKQMIEIVE